MNSFLVLAEIRAGGFFAEVNEPELREIRAMSLWMKTAKRGAMLLPLAGMAGLAAHAQDASAVSAYVDSSYLFLIGGLIVMFMAAGFLCLESGLVRSKNASMQSLKNVALFSVAGLMFWQIGRASCRERV